MTKHDDPLQGLDGAIAITGMSAHLPGAADIDQYWANLRDGIESIRHLSVDELIANGESPARLRQKNYVPASSILEGFERFDADFFGLSPKEAAIMDPQHRQFLECAWEAFENSGHTPEGFDGPIGVFAGCGMGSYFYFNICSNADLVKNTGMFLLRHTGNDKDFLSTRVSHIFDLKGPSLSIQTACSTSLVAVHQAAQSLLNGECDMALAGGVTIELPHGRGYLFEDGEILSPDGHCHAFDHRAQGTVFGSGAGCVVLRRLEDAIADGDHIWAVVRGTAVNNDGSAKAGYLAPSVEGQARAIAEAQAVAGIDAGTVGYVECHGTGTYLGDPIEVAALTQAFEKTTDAKGFCGIGSVKTNIGHTDTAAGVASLIKVSMALHHGQIPPSLGYEAPNPAIDFEDSPFMVNDRLRDFPRLNGAPRRAGVNSLGVGGTNAHAVVEEAPARAASEESDWPFQLLVLSARSKTALDQASSNLAAHLRAHPEQPLADVAWTLKEGRRAFEHRRVLVAHDHDEAAAKLEEGDPRKVFTHQELSEPPEVVFMFPGGGAQFAGMARDLYETEPVFQEWMDRGLDHLAPSLDYDLRAVWLPEAEDHAAAVERLKKPSVQLPLIMITEYALAQLWMSWGVQPAALIGHSMGENTAACLAGVMSFEDCIGLVHLRGQLFDTIAPGGMLSVPLSREALQAYWADDLDMASVNAPDLCVVSGPQAALDDLEQRLAKDEIEAQRIQIDIAAHSRMLEPILTRFGDYLRSIPLNAPKLPVISNRTGQPLTAAEATSPDYWVAHLRNTVNFADGIACLTQSKNRVYLEVGPGRALSSLAQANGIPSNQVMPSLRHPEQQVADDEWFISTLGRLWAVGVAVDWTPIWGEARRNRVPLPTYPFQRSSYFIEPGQVDLRPEEDWAERIEGVENWGWQPHWRPRAAETEIEADDLRMAEPCTWLVFADEAGLAERAIARLRGVGHKVIEVRAGDIYAQTGEDSFTLSPERGREDYDRLIHDLVAQGLAPQRIAHFWLVTASENFRPGSSFFHRNQEQGFYSLMFLAQAIAEENLPRPIHVMAATTG
ncbi:type I polyketide synthase, partial [Paracoccus seriniphilus]|uniref:type I polyketide synthase n=1 Tax=Paracoccus seriniphilus TaxID=184748 RepID=UPI003563532E